MIQKSFEDEIYDQLALIGKAVASPRRLKILDLLSQSPRTVESLSKEANMTIANTSQHLKVLAKTYLVKSEKNGLFVTYRLASKEVGSFFRSIRSIAKSRLAEIDRITNKFIDYRLSYKIENVGALLDQLEKGELVVVDVRPHEEYVANHIRGALSLPLEQLEKRINELSADRDIIIYCRGPFCVLSVKAVEILRAEGYKAMRLDQGISEWEAAGLPIEVGSD